MQRGGRTGAPATSGARPGMVQQPQPAAGQLNPVQPSGAADPDLKVLGQPAGAASARSGKGRLRHIPARRPTEGSAASAAIAPPPGVQGGRLSWQLPGITCYQAVGSIGIRPGRGGARQGQRRCCHVKVHSSVKWRS